MEVYLDNAATTRPAKEVVEIMTEVLTKDFGNPSSKHMKGVEAEKYIKEAKSVIAEVLKCKDKEIIFTSCATESNNQAIFGIAKTKCKQGKHIITTAIEHASVREPFLELEKEGFEVDFLSVDREGKVSLEDLRLKLRPDTIFVSIMHVNNEVGTIEPVEEIGKIIKEYNKNIIYHVDAVQSFGKLEKVFPKNMQADLLSASAHKFHGPKGAGFLYIKEGLNIKPLILGGGQQKGQRSGTENVPAIAGMGKAVSLIYKDKSLTEKLEKAYGLRDYFVGKLSVFDGVKINGAKDKNNSPLIVSAIFEGIKSEVLLHSLEDKGIYVSSGSACSSNKPGLSFTLAAMGLSKQDLDSVIRFSFNFETKHEDLDLIIETLEELLPFLRQFTKR